MRVSKMNAMGGLVVVLAAVAAGAAAQERTVPGPAPEGPLLKMRPPKIELVLQPQLSGWVDLHAHPMTHLAFGGKLIHGAPDVGSLIPADSACRHKVRATSLEHALGTDNSTHGGWGMFDNGCGDDFRKAVVDALQSENGALVTPDWARGANDFLHWPKWNDITHQKMWVDWIRRAHWGGARVMVALATHNQTLAAAVSGPGDGPTDDKGSADLQLDETIALVGRHPDFMEIARTPADLRRIVSGGKLAIVLGVEIDAIGNFHRGPDPTNAQVSAEIHRLHAKGVRYIFPIHLIDNKFGGTAAYKGTFNFSNYRETGSFWDLRCSAPADRVTYRYTVDGFDAAVAVVKAVKLGIDPLRNPPTPPNCAAGTGHVNRKGLTPLGEYALREMMKLGMLVDIDHMSQASADRALTLAERVPNGGYPLNSGHNGLRVGGGSSENSRTVAQIKRIAALKGLFGVGTEAADPRSFATSYLQVALAMGMRGVGLGTDLNGLVKAPLPAAGRVRYDATFQKARTGSKEWDYNEEGVAHYGLLPDFLRAVEGVPGGAEVKRTLLQSAEHFAQTWEACERQKVSVR